jgi:hypothetical protein
VAELWWAVGTNVPVGGGAIVAQTGVSMQITVHFIISVPSSHYRVWGRHIDLGDNLPLVAQSSTIYMAWGLVARSYGDTNRWKVEDIAFSLDKQFHI